ncbi:MAG: amidohydrolase [Planctomycetes bacterium]|nr:amidohydrolase [Planctomycetota bacterium]
MKMNLGFVFSVLVVCAATAACHSPRVERAQPRLGDADAARATAPQAATLYEHGRVYAGGPDWQSADGLLVAEGRVLGVGGADALLELASARGVTELSRVDLGGRTVLPGLHDAHGHLEGYGDMLETVDLRGAASVDEIVERVVARAAETPQGRWIRGRGWDQNLFADPRFPEHGPLSARTSEHPVFLERVDGHAAWVNARALALAGLEGDLRGRERLQGGEVLLDAEGRATGVLIDTATELVERVIPRPTLDERWARVERAARALVGEGLVAVHDMGVDRELAERLVATPLPLRAFVYRWANQGLTSADRPRRSAGVARANEIVGAKLMIDGALGSRGAALLADYSDAPGARGHLLVTEARLVELVRACSALGLQPAVHAIGDRGNRVVLDAFAAVPAVRSLRPRVEHAQIVAPEDWRRFAELGALPSMQPTHATSDMPWAEARLGRDRLAGAYAWRRLPARSVPLAFGSDFPVERPNPFEGLYAAITRTDARGEPPGGWLPDQRVTLGEALDAFTAGAAFAVAEERELGRLAPGFAADFVVVDRDPFAVSSDEVRGTRVLATVVAGECVFGTLESARAAR